MRTDLKRLAVVDLAIPVFDQQLVGAGLFDRRKIRDPPGAFPFFPPAVERAAVHNLPFGIQQAEGSSVREVRRVRAAHHCAFGIIQIVSNLGVEQTV
jgi:hypothetical protein